MLADTTPPSGGIRVEEKVWSAFSHTVTFGIFSKDRYDVTITAADDASGIAKVEYLLSHAPISESDIAAATGWQTYSPFALETEGRYIVYARITDQANNVTYISSDGMVLDRTAPVIGGIEDGKTYCGGVSFTVSDDHFDYVTVNGEKVNVYTLEEDGDSQQYTIRAYDKAGNESLTYTVTVHSGHTFMWVIDKEATATENGEKHEECSVCGYKKDPVEIPATGEDTRPPSTGDDTPPPSTGDTGRQILWLVMLIVSGAVLTKTALCCKKKKRTD